MKKTIICFLLGAIIMSCNSTNISVENEKASLTNDVTIEDIMAVQVEDYFCHYMEDIDLPGDFPIPDAVDIYNAATFVNSLYSTDDFWMVFENTDEAMKLLQKADPFIIKNASLRQIAQECCDKYRYFLERCDTMCDSIAYLLWTEFKDALWILDSTLATDYSLSRYTDLTEDEYWSAFDNRKQSDVIVERFGYEISTSDVAAFLSEIDTISDFELKCSYTYAMTYYSGFMMASSLESSIKSMLENLLTDGRYSHHLFNMWRVWRAIVQYEYGASKMSDIANGIYNKMRLKVATTTLNYLINNPDDKVAINQYLMISYHKNTLRNGEYDYGNQSIIDMYYLGLVR